MVEHRTSIPRRESRLRPAVLAAGRYVLLPLAFVATGAVVVGASPGIGWALIVFGGWLAANAGGQRLGRRAS